MGYLAAFAIILTAGVVAALATALNQRHVDLELRRRNHDVGSVVFLQLGTVFAVFLAFTFSEVWSAYNETQLAIDHEVAAMHGAAMIATTLSPPAAADAILSAQRAYLESVAYQEWPVMAARRTGDHGTERKFAALMREAANLQLAGPDQSEKKATILSLLTQAHVHRETRIYEASNGVPVPLWGVLIAFTVMLSIFVTLSQIQNATIAVAISACFAATDFIAAIGKISDLAH